MISEEQLNVYRLAGTPVRVIRDIHEFNDVRGVIVAWDDASVLLRKRNRKVVKLSREYTFEPLAADPS